LDPLFDALIPEMLEFLAIGLVVFLAKLQFTIYCGHRVCKHTRSRRAMSLNCFMVILHASLIKNQAGLLYNLTNQDLVFYVYPSAAKQLAFPHLCTPKLICLLKKQVKHLQFSESVHHGQRSSCCLPISSLSPRVVVGPSLFSWDAILFTCMLICTKMSSRSLEFKS
jgi:hypothetical protein